MNNEEIKQLLEGIKKGSLTVENGLNKLKYLPFQDLGHTKLDNHRELRQGYPEVIFCMGKTTGQVSGIINSMVERGQNVLCTRANKEMYEAVAKNHSTAKYHELSRIITLKQNEYEVPASYISVVTAGTSDIPVAEEAAITGEFYNNKVERFYDIGVAGIHRIQGNIEKIAGQG